MLTSKKTLLEGFAKYTSADELASVSWDTDGMTEKKLSIHKSSPCLALMPQFVYQGFDELKKTT